MSSRKTTARRSSAIQEEIIDSSVVTMNDQSRHDSKPRRLFLVRHCESTSNRLKILQGQNDNAPLTPRGHEQANKLAEIFSAVSVDRVWSSPLKRALQTATIIARVHGLEPIAEPRIQDVHMGKFQGKSIKEIQDKWSDLWRRWKQDPSSVNVPGSSETLQHVQQRAINFLTDVWSDNTWQTGIVVSHSGVIRTIIAHVLGISIREMWRHNGYPIPNGSIYLLCYPNPTTMNPAKLIPWSRIRQSLHNLQWLTC